MAGGRNLDLLRRVSDPESTLRRLGNDVELMEQIILIFLEDAPALVRTAQQALSRDDAIELRRASHSLKGLMATISASAGVNVALRLEQAAANGDLSSAAALIRDCGQCVEEVAAALQAYCESGDAVTSGPASPSRP